MSGKLSEQKPDIHGKKEVSPYMKGYNSARSGKKTTRMLAGQRRQEKKDIRNSRDFGYVYAFLTGITVFIILIAAFALFFNIKEIKVYGNDHYSAEEIIGASGFEIDDNLYLFNKFGRIQRIFAALPYLDEIRIRRNLPDTLTITVTETKEYFAILQESSVWLADTKGKLLEEVSSDYDISGLVSVIGVVLDEGAATGDNIGSMNDSTAESFTELVEALKETDMLDKAGDIDLTEAFSLIFTYENRLTVNTGMPDNLGNKMIYLEEVVGQLSESDTGYIDLSGDQIRFIPESSMPEGSEDSDTASPETQTDTEESSETTETGSNAGSETTETGSTDTENTDSAGN